MDNRKIIFLHIPKTGGTTLFGITNNQYKKSQILSVGSIREEKDYEKYTKLPEERKKKIAFIRGHLPYGFHNYIEDPSTYICLLRNPVDRVLSHYYHVVRDPEHYLYQQVTESKMTLEEYALNPITHEMDNGQTRSVSGLSSKPKIGECTEEMLQMAKDNIMKDFAVAGVIEYFDEFLIMLRKEFDWKYPVYYKKRIAKNRKEAQSKNPITPEIRQAIAERNKYDVELHQFVKQNFEKVIQENKELLEKEIPILKQLNVGYARYGAVRDFVKDLLGMKKY